MAATHHELYIRSLIDQRARASPSPLSPTDSVFPPASERPYSPSVYSHYPDDARDSYADSLPGSSNPGDSNHGSLPPNIHHLPTSLGPSDTMSTITSIAQTSEASESDLRLSMFGPKIKAISPAPWEDEGDNSPSPYHPAGTRHGQYSLDISPITIPIQSHSPPRKSRTRARSKTITNAKEKSKDKDGGIFRGFHALKPPGTANSDQSSISSRSSTDTHAGLSSLMTHNTPSQPQLGSTTSFKSGIAQKISIPRLYGRSRAVSSASGTTRSSVYSISSSAKADPFAPVPPVPVLSRYNSHQNDLDAASFVSSPPQSPEPFESDYIHPFANPAVWGGSRDSLVSSTSYPEPDLDDTIRVSQLRQTTTDSVGSNLSSPSYAQGSQSSTTLRSVMSSGPLTTSELTPSSSTVESNPKLRGVPMGLLGLPDSPAFNLISLEQARERAAKRSLSGGIQIKTASDGVSTFGSSSLAVPNSSGTQCGTSASHLSSSNPSYSTTSLSSTVSPAPSPQSHRNLSKKKSGFLKFFEKRDTPAPIPSLPSGGGRERKESTGPSTPRSPHFPPISSPIPHEPLSQSPPNPSACKDPSPSLKMPHKYQTMNRGTESASIGGIPAIPTSSTASSNVAPSAPSAPTSRSTKTSGAKKAMSSLSFSGKKKVQHLMVNTDLPEPSADMITPTLHLRPVSATFSNMPAELFTSPRSPRVPFPSNEGKVAGNHSLGSRGRTNTNASLGDSLLPSPTTPSFHSNPSSLSSTTFSDLLTPLSALEVKGTLFTLEPHPSGLSNSALRSSPGPNIADTANANVSPEARGIITALQDQIVATRKAWRLQLWELESQLREMKTELEEVKKERCANCGSSREDSPTGAQATTGVVDRPRVKTGGGSRTTFGSGWGGD